jgi:heme A synthase
METIKFLHSYWAYLVLLIVVLATINSIVGMLTKKEFGAKDFRIALFALIVTHIQLLIGIVLYVFANNFGDVEMSDIMHNPSLRLKNIEHPLLMVVAITLLTIGYSKHKNKRTSSAKFKTLAIPYALALVAMLAMIPWKAWLG